VRPPHVCTHKGTSTEDGCAQVSDGAAAVLLMRRSKAKELGLKPLARFVGMAVVGVEPSVMGIGARPPDVRVATQRAMC
jgi:acetyl-CoA acetyltransferase